MQFLIKLQSNDVIFIVERKFKTFTTGDTSYN